MEYDSASNDLEKLVQVLHKKLEMKLKLSNN